MLKGTRDQVFLRSFGSPPPTIRGDAGQYNFLQNSGFDYNQFLKTQRNYSSSIQYIPINDEIAKSYVIPPTNQGQRAAITQRAAMMIDPRDNPSRSQFSQGYTDPIQVFGGTPGTTNVWNTHAGLSAKGRRARQPNWKFVSPFSTLPIPTRMPWDV